MRDHGPFTVGRDARDAVKAAVMLEDVARTVHIARQLGDAPPIAAADVDRLYERYQNVYGQPVHERSRGNDASRQAQVWFLTGQPAPLRRGDARAGRRPVASRSSGCSPPPAGCRAEIVGKPVLTDAAAIRRVMLEANADPELPRA